MFSSLLQFAILALGSDDNHSLLARASPSTSSLVSTHLHTKRKLKTFLTQQPLNMYILIKTILINPKTTSSPTFPTFSPPWLPQSLSYSHETQMQSIDPSHSIAYCYKPYSPHPNLNRHSVAWQSNPSHPSKALEIPWVVCEGIGVV
mmetsp:Transcript_8875/g.16752  ORF Transcript_8875/g.16752 Transcript_8875/m.16752 type:complete len:147 (-) Transcript_8875:653-1093(-)